MMSTLVSKMNTRMTPYQSDQIALLATVIDPRFKIETKFVEQSSSIASYVYDSDDSEMPQETGPDVEKQILDCITAKLVEKIIKCNDLLP